MPVSATTICPTIVKGTLYVSPPLSFHSSHAALGRQVETAGPQDNLFVVLFGFSVHDAGVLPTPNDFTISFSCEFV